jgi:hypothetical protein
MRDSTRLERTSQVVRGDRSELRLENGTITVTKEATTQATPTTVTVGIEQVRNVALERSSRGGRGWLHLGVVDGSPAPPTELAAASDPYTLPLTARQVPAARRLARMIDDHVRRRGLPHAGDGDRSMPRSSGVIVSDLASAPGHLDPASPPPPPRPAPPADAPAPPPAPTDQDGTDAPAHRSGEELIGRLRELADLHREGALSDEEFHRAKQQVLGR